MPDLATWEGYDGDRLAFEILPDRKRRGKWRLWRVSIECWETGYFDSEADAKAWVGKLNNRIEWRQP